MPRPPANLSPNGGELSRLIAAAVVNEEFRNLLLTHPDIALAAGCNGEPFRLTPQERDLLLSIHATSLKDLAEQLAKATPDSAPVRRARV
jgi:hypothetical protein